MAACKFWTRNLPIVSCEVPVNPQHLLLAVSYSDGEGETAGVGIALWLPCGEVVAGYTQVPDELRLLWTQRQSLGDAKDIFEIEAVGPLLVLWNWGCRFKSHLRIHFIDNEGSLAALAKGSSSVLSGELIVGMTHELVAQHGIVSWFDRVDSSSNPVDKLSRGSMDGPWKLVRIHFPPALRSRLRESTGTCT